MITDMSAPILILTAFFAIGTRAADFSAFVTDTSATLRTSSAEATNSGRIKETAESAFHTDSAADPAKHGAAVSHVPSGNIKYKSDKTGTAATSPANPEGTHDLPAAPASEIAPDPLESDTYGTGSESATAAKSSPKLPDSGDAPTLWLKRIAALRNNLGLSLAVVDLSFVLALLTGLMILKRGLSQVLRKLDRRIERLEKADPNAPLRADLANLRKMIEGFPPQLVVANAEPPIPKADLYSGIDVDHPHVSPPGPSQPKFPVLISEYISQQPTRAVRVRATQLDHELFTRDQEGEFYLIDDAGALYVVPIHNNMPSSYFRTYYGASYDCTSPGSGDLYLIQPAEVTAKGDAWRLASRGKLEARMS
jgi:hypothetical protein